MNNHYETLSISPSASQEQIKAAYTNAVLKIQGQPNFASRFAEIQEAYDILSNPSTRKIFDDKLLSFYTGMFVDHNTTIQKQNIQKEEPKRKVKPLQPEKINPLLKEIGIKLAIIVGLIFFAMLFKTCSKNKPTEVVADSSQVNHDLPGTEPETNQPIISENATNNLPVTESIPVPIESPFKGKHLSNGYSPFDECFGSGDYSGRAILLVKNGTSNEAIVCLFDVNSGSTIRNEYIRKGASFTLSSIPQGSYKIRVLFGNDWNPNAPSPCGSIGFFDSDIDFSEKDQAVFFSDNESGVSSATYTLYGVIGGNSKSSKIDKSKFFKK